MKRFLLATAVLVAACNSPVAQATTAPTPAFDLAAVRANFTDECKDPVVVDDQFCKQVQLQGMTADGDILNVPTTLSAAATDRAKAICNQIAAAHFDSSGVALGFNYIGILDKDGGHAAACSIR